MTSGDHIYDLVLFGVLGDLSRRKLLPALYQLEKAELLDEQTRIIGVARDSYSNEQFALEVKQSISQFVPSSQFNDEVWQRLSARLVYCEIDLTDKAGYQALAGLFKSNTEHSKRAVISYLATPPALFSNVMRRACECWLEPLSITRRVRKATRS